MRRVRTGRGDGGLALAALAAVSFAGYPARVEAATYYVCDDGGDCNSGAGSGWATGDDARSRTEAQSRSSPWQTIDHAEENVAPGDVVVVGDGTYDTRSAEWAEAVLYIEASGTAASPITFRAENRWGAIIDGHGTMAAGIWIRCEASPASHVRIEGFEIVDFGGEGVESKDANGAPYDTRCTDISLTGLHVRGARFSGIVLEATESSVVEGCVVHDVPGTDASVVNQFHGVYIGDNTDAIVIRNNVIYDIPFGWPIHIYDRHDRGGAATNHTIVNNTLIDTNMFRGGGVVAYGSGHVIRNNILFEAVTSAGRTAAIEDSTDSGVVAVIENNLTNQTRLCNNGCPGATVAGNLLDIDLGAEFTDPSGADFTELPGAPSIDVGSSMGAPDVDFAGVHRPQGLGWDIGAYELVVDAPTPDAGTDEDNDAGDGGGGGGDAGSTARDDVVDGSAGGDAGAGGGSDGGCGCDVTRARPIPGSLVILSALFLAWWRRSRRAQHGRGPARPRV